MLRFQVPVILALMAQAPCLEAQVSAQVDTAQIDSLRASLSVEWERLVRLSFQTTMSEVTRTLLNLHSDSAREGMAITERLRFIAILRAESPNNASLTEKLLREAAGLKRQSATLGNVVHDELAGSTLDQLLIALVAQATALEGSIGFRDSAR